MPKSNSGKPAQRLIPKIVCINRATVSLDIPFNALVRALQAYVDEHVAPVWGTPARLVAGKNFVKGAWAMVFLDDANQATGRGTKLADHDLTPEGLPLAKVFVNTALLNGEFVSAAASHELVEMLIDPSLNMMTTGPGAGGLGKSRIMYAYESADPVEETTFKVRGVPMSNFVYPSWFEVFHKAGSIQFDHMKTIDRPFQLLSGGYQIIFKAGKWSAVYGSARKKKSFQLEDRRGHRSEIRKKSKTRRAPRI
ncbi:MAG TPA: hypothetical protein VKT73_16665 [Xanthobacteraceae bacterium]|nr:hypothetical protein [Xanthobacteraceae bacterium]